MARDLNLTKLESRPTKKALGEYCFVMDIEGHIADEVVADCLRDLHATLPAVKFLGSYPAASGTESGAGRRPVTRGWRQTAGSATCGATWAEDRPASGRAPAQVARTGRTPVLTRARGGRPQKRQAAKAPGR